MTFKVVDKTTGEAPDYTELALKIGDRLMYSDIEGFALLETGTLILCDRCGNWDYVDIEKENLRVVFEEDE